MGITPEELADRQRWNRERRQQAKAAKVAAKALAAGVSIAEMKERIKANKAAARAAQQAADRRRDLTDEAQVLLAEAEWRGAIIPPADRDALRAITSRKGFREIGEEAAVAAIKRVGDMIHVLAVANARRLRDGVIGRPETLQ